ARRRTARFVPRRAAPRRSRGRRRGPRAASGLRRDVLEELGDERRDGRTLGAGEGDVREERVAGELLDDRRDAVVPSDAQVVALRDVVREDDARVLADARQDGEEDAALEGLGLVDDDERVVEGA